MEAAIGFFGIIAVMLLLLAKEIRQELRYKKQSYATLAEFPDLAEEDRDIYLRQEAYNRYDYTRYRGDKP